MKRIMIAAPASGSGKTLFTCGLLKVLKDKYQNIISFKCGPDYIDPMFHRAVIGIHSMNLDTYFQSQEEISKCLFQGSGMIQNQAPIFGVIEGVMGVYDGLGGTEEEGSAYHLAKLTHTPIVLILDAHGMGKTMVSVLKGICADDTEHLICGVVLNRTSEAFAKKMKPLIEDAIERPLLGVLPKLPGIDLESRHLGLKLPEEIPHLQQQVERVAETIRTHIDLDLLEQIAIVQNQNGKRSQETDFVQNSEQNQNQNSNEEALVLAVARDEAFCFYYEQNLQTFREHHIKIREFSPIHDTSLPPCDGLLLGGGYPELCAQALSDNRSMCQEIQAKLKSGLPSLAECGGFMYLHEYLEDQSGQSYPMVGAIPGKTFDTGKLCRFGYVSLQIGEDTVLGHEFHYFDSTSNGSDVMATKPSTGAQYPCMHKGKNHLWGFPHLYYPSAPELTEWFIKQMEVYHGKFI